MSRPKIVIKSKSNQDSNQPVQPPKEEIIESKIQASEISESIIETQNIPNNTSNKPNPKTKWFVITGIAAILILSALVFYFFFYSSDDTNLGEENTELNGPKEKKQYEEIYQDFEKDILSETTTFSTLMNKIGIAGADINLLKKRISGLGVNTLRKGDKFSIFYNNEIPELVVIEPKSNPYNKIEIDLNALKVQKIEKKREIRIQEMAGIVETNLGITFINNNLNLQLINKLEEIFEYSVDLFQVDDGDRFKILYEQEFLDGRPYEVRGIKAAYIQEGKRNYYAFMKKEGNKVKYYNEFGESMKRSFLSSPIKYGGVVTSGFGLRVHPKLGYRKMHLGTDYAASEGTPIVAVADGIVTGRAFAGDNGNFIKLKHDNVYETQYLHMQKFNPSVRLGSRVKQGQVIGYVGMTGLATGPHVCFRFKKEGEQVNPKDHNGGTSSRIQNTELSDYKDYIIPIKKAIKKIEYF